jgi:hypothetical protein
MQIDDRRAESSSYRRDLSQTIRSGQTVLFSKHRCWGAVAECAGVEPATKGRVKVHLWTGLAWLGAVIIARSLFELGFRISQGIGPVLPSTGEPLTKRSRGEGR